MNWKDYKYLLAYIIPLSGIFSLLKGGQFSFTTVVIAFVLLPVLDSIVPSSKLNLSLEEKKQKELNKYFDALLLINLPLVYITAFYFFQNLIVKELSLLEHIGMTLSTAIVFTTAGINVAHELGHKPEKYNQVISKLLLLPSLYMHFFIEHNRGHHLKVGTDADPASAKKNENVYFFILRSVSGQWMDAWRIEKKRVGTFFGMNNQMFQITLATIAVLLTMGLCFGLSIVLNFILVAVISFLHLEIINYVEHYGLRRKKLGNGRYEKVKAHHSWNSNHELGRIMLYELTRHSDHHYKAAKKYQTLDHHDESPQLPYGYPASLLLSLLPPLWFKVMNKRIPTQA